MKKIDYADVRHNELNSRYVFGEGTIEAKSGKVESEFRSISVKEVSSSESENTKTYVISDSSIDRYNEIVDPRGLDWKQFDKSKKTVFFNHDYNFIIGRSQWQKLENETWISKLEFATSTQDARDIRNLAFDGFVGMTSIGFIPQALEVANLEDIKDLSPSNRGDFDPKTTIWIWRKSEGLEYSLVGIGANRNANEVKSVLAKGLIKSSTVINYVNRELEVLEIRDLMKDNADKVQDILTKMAEFDTLKTENAALKNEIETIKKQLEKPVEKLAKRSGMTPAEKAAFIRECISGDFSRATGRKVKP